MRYCTTLFPRMSHRTRGTTPTTGAALMSALLVMIIITGLGVAAITRTDTAPRTVIEAIRIARDAGFETIKINAVLMRGFNDDEIADFADFAREHDVNYRLIEFMPLDSSRAWSRESVVSADEALAAIRRRHDLVQLNRDDPSSTALEFAFADGGPGRRSHSPADPAGDLHGQP